MNTLSLFWSGLNHKKKISLFVAVLLLLAASGAGFYWLTKTESALLYSNLDDQETANVVTKLKEMGIEYTFSEGGSDIYVNKNMLNNARYDLISNGLALHNSVGFELFDTADFGLTEFAQQINYQRALEGETARTITSFDFVKNARVHLSLPKNGTLTLNKEQPKASVALVLYPEMAMNRKQIDGIKRLVASAVTGLTIDNVTIVDGNGVGFTIGDEESVNIDDRLKYKRDVEIGMKSKLSTILNQLFGEDLSEVAIDITFNFDKKIQTTKDIKLPDNQQTILKKKEIKRSERAGEASKGGGNSNDHELEEEYAYGSETTKSEFSIGRIERITVAVALTTIITSEEKDSLKRIMSAAIGLKPSRGDLIEVEAFKILQESNTDGIESSISPKSTLESDVVLSSAESAVKKPLPVLSFNENVLNYTNPLFSIITLSILLAMACTYLVILVLRQRNIIAANALSEDDKKELLLDVQKWLVLANGPIRVKEFR